MSKLDDLRRLRESRLTEGAHKRAPRRPKLVAAAKPRSDAVDASGEALMTPAAMGRKGGKSRMRALTPEQRSELARLGGIARAAKLKQDSTP